ncbi:MAG: hypothetical protein GY858_08435 [Candidatus Omnitrophica bacterium]|nr:hypothetical protein [Candidatus Omnitrophota bacterium]
MNLKKDIVYWSKLLNERGLITARSGNVSCKVGANILITCHDCYLGHLEEDDILLMDLNGNVLEGKRPPSSETQLHLAVHNKFKDISVVLHSHSPFSTAFFHYFNKLDIFSFEAKFYLGDIAVLPQKTPTVTDVGPVVQALEDGNVIVLKNHGVVAMGKDFKESFSLIELLEEQSRVNLTVRGKDAKISLDADEDYSTSHKEKLLSGKHIELLVKIINEDQQVQQLGKQYDLTCTLAVEDQDSDNSVCFHYQNGKIVKVDQSKEAEFVISGTEEILKKVFNRKIDPFVASTQGKVKVKGDFAKMSKWYPVMTETFKLWGRVEVF